MPDTLRHDLTELVWDKVGDWVTARPTLLARLKVGNRTRQTERGKLKEMVSRAPADFAHMSCVVERLTGPSWPQAKTLAGEAQAFRNSTTDFTVTRAARIVFTIRCRLPGATEDTINLGDEVANAIFEAGPQLGTSWVVATGEPTVDERDTRDNEQPQPGKVYTVTFDITARQMGRALLTAITTI